MGNYFMYHSHTHASNPTTTMQADSITRFDQYLDLAVQYEMPSICFSEHGSVMNWVKKKEETEKRGIKYVHANEIYLTEHIDKEVGLKRDNYHYMLIAKNWNGVKELNRLTSSSNNKEDGHFYYNPRVTFDELFNTSDDIIMTTACLASPLWRSIKDNNIEIQERLMNFFINNKHRMFFEIQYHNHPEQIEYNKWLYNMSKECGIPLIAGTDTHSLNQDHAEARKILMKAKGASYGDEDAFDLTFKSYDELVDMFKKQNSIPADAYMEAIHNTNVMADMIEEFSLDRTSKYPELYDKPEELFKEKIKEGIKVRGINKLPKDEKEVYFQRIRDEYDTYKKLNAISYMLLQKNIIDWCYEHEIYPGYSRGSVAGSLIAYLLKVTDVDSLKYNLNFTRFLNPDRVTNADIDTDYPPSRRQEVIDYVASLDGVYFCEIITFNTVAMKGAIREVGRALGLNLPLIDEISKNIDVRENEFRSKYPELFKYVDLIKGTIVSVGSHPSGYVVSPINLSENIGLCYTKESKYPVSQINMKELDGLMYIKLDILGLDNVEAINDTCKLAGIERKTPDNTNFYDENVWNSIRNDNLGIFQWESDSAKSFLQHLFSDATINKIKQRVDTVNYLDLFSMGNGAIRPAGASYRDDLANGVFKDNGNSKLNEFLSNTLGQCIFQEQIMGFLVEFCGFSNAESDLVRRGLAKKTGTEEYIPKIKNGFIKVMNEKYSEPEERSKDLIEYFLDVIKNSSSYGFSLNHSNPYSMIGYVNGWLRYYYPLEYLTTLMNIREDKMDKTAKIIQYAKNNGIEIKPIKFRKSIDKYNLNKKEKAIYKGLKSIKFLNKVIAEELYGLKDNKYSSFLDLLIDIAEKTSVNSKQMKILIQLNFFDEFGDNKKLLDTYEKFEKRYKKSHKEKTKMHRLNEIKEYIDTLENESLSIKEQLLAEKDFLGYIESIYPELDKSHVLVTSVDTKYSPKISLYQLATGKETIVKMSKQHFFNSKKEPLFKDGDVINIGKTEKRPASKKVDGKWVKDFNNLETWLINCSKM